ncbi:uncharacterized protein LOC122282779 isoform X2 [Carya illinoinensis]|uniref:uncharacterized protein LOC122282779 isoform X2 n=1 Tax=Carya illinoinensis TaxID=32201 RepID=UPI001C721217|nr:uncharacterized protein LOC122282779 isoform X2 [Carya illinoinensis]
MRNHKGMKVAIGETSNKNDRSDVSPPPGFHPCLKEKRDVTWETSNADNGREVSPPPGFPFRPREERFASWKTSIIKLDDREVLSLPLSFSPRHKGNKIATCDNNDDDRDVSPPPGFPPGHKRERVATRKASSEDDREVSSHPGFPPHHKVKRVATWETLYTNDGREVSPLSSFPPGHKGKKVATWKISNIDDDHEISFPPSFPPCHNGKRVVDTWETSEKDDREVSLPPGFPPHKKSPSMFEMDRWKLYQKVWNNIAESNAKLHSIGGEKTKSPVLLPSLPKVVAVKIVERSEDRTKNEKDSSPNIMIPSKGKEKLTPVLPVIPRPTDQKSAKQHDIVPHTSTNSISTIPSKISTHHHVTSIPSAPFGLAESNNFLKTGPEKFYPHITANSLKLISLLLCQGFGYSNPRSDFTFARQRLSLLLPINIQVLLDPVKSKEIVDLSAILQKDTTLGANQVAMLKLISEEIPSLSKEVLQIQERVEQSLVDLKSNSFKVACLCNEYSKSKEKLRTLQAEIDADVANMQEFGIEIEAPSARHSLLVCSLEMKKKAVVEVESFLEDIMSKIHKISMT